MNGYRRAAATLHGLDAIDRAWVLGELADGEREVLHGLLRELDELGFEPALLRAGAAAPAPGTAQAAQRVAGASAAAMREIMAGEPAVLVAQVLRIAAWPWTAGFWSELPAARQAAVREAIDGALASAPERDRRLVERLAGALDQSARRRAAAPPAPRLINRMVAWIR